MFKIRFVFLLTFIFLLTACGQSLPPNEGAEVTQPQATAAATQVPTITEVPAATEAPVVTEPQTGALDAFIAQLQTAVTNQDYAQMQALMSDPIIVGAWRSEWRLYTPDQMIAEFQNGALPAPLAVQFTRLSDDEMTQRIGQPPATMFGPETNMVAALFSTGWGQSTSDEAILFVVEKDGVYTWSAFLYTNGRFADANLSLVVPPVGLIYSVAGDGIYQIQPDGFHRQLLDAQTAAIPNLKVSPDGRQSAYLNDERQLWLINNDTGDQQQLAGDVNLSYYLAWGDNSNLFVGVWLDPNEVDGPNNGHITTVQTSTRQVTILDETQLSSGRPAMLADYNRSAFDVFATGLDDHLTGRLYHPDSGLQTFDQTTFSAQNDMIAGPLFNPAWSPVGTKMSWLTSTGERFAVQVFDLETQTAVQIHDWDPARFGALVPSPVWSPDGQWLALEIWANGPEGSGVWLLAADGSSQTLVDADGYDPYWATATELVYSVNGSARLYDLPSKQIAKLDLPEGSWVLGVTPMAELLALPEIMIRVDDTGVAYVLAVQDVPMYNGDNDSYEQIGTIFGGQTAKVTGMSTVSGWWRVICPDDTVGNCWLPQDNAYTLPIENAEPDVNLPNPAELMLTAEQFPSPDGRWLATVSQSEPVIIEGNEKFYTALTIEDGTTTWKPVDEWRGYGLGYMFPAVLQWSADGRYIYYTNKMLGDGCILFLNATDLYRFDVESGGAVEILPSGLTWNLALAPDESQLAYTSFNGQGVVVTVRDVASYKEQGVVVAESASNIQSGNIVWSPDGATFLLTVADDACGPNWTHSIVRVDVGDEGLTAVTLIEKDARQFTILDWSDSGQTEVRLLDKDGNTWWLAANSGKVTQEK